MISGRFMPGDLTHESEILAMPNVRSFRATLRDGKLRENQNCDNIHAPKAKQE